MSIRNKRAKSASGDAGSPVLTETRPLYFLREELAAIRNLARELWEDRIFLLILILLAFLTRFWGLSQASLWMDEIALFREAYTEDYTIVSRTAHAFHLKALHLSMQFFGQNEFGLRFFGAVMGAMAVPLCFVFGRWGGNRHVGIALALLALSNSFLILYAQDGNYYGTLTFFAALGFVLYALFFRGAPIIAFLLLPIVGFSAFKTHPIAQIPFAVLAGGMVVGALVFPKIRNSLFRLNPGEWLARPALPASILGLAGVGIIAMPRIRQALAEPLSMIQLGGSTLTNVDFNWALFSYHLTAFGVNFFKISSLDYWLMWIPFLLFLAGFPLVVLHWFRTRNPVHLAMGGLGLMLPLASYVILFSIQLDRNFNLRYFIYLVPTYLMMIAFAATIGAAMIRKDKEVSPWKDLPFIALLILPLGIGVVYSLNYHITDKSNYRAGMEYLASVYQGEPIIVPTRNDTVQAMFYLDQFDLPTVSPEFDFFNTPFHANIFAGSLPFMFHGMDTIWMPSAWRFHEAHNFYSLKDTMDTPFVGKSRLGHGHDLRLHRWDFGDRVVGTHAGARFQVPSTGGEVPVLFMGPGQWRLNGFPDNELGLVSREYMRVMVPADGAVLTAIPVLPGSVRLRFDMAINQPEHTRFSAIQVDGETFVRSEREGPFDFLVYQPSGEDRQLVVVLSPRDESDPLLQRNNPPIPSGLFLSVAINGIHEGYWRVPSEEKGILRIPLDINLPEGNNRVTIAGIMPRLAYTPYLPWLFGGIEWNATREQAQPSLESDGRIRLGQGWTSPLPRLTPGQPLPSPWQVAGERTVVVDEDLLGPAGDPAIRVEFPPDEQGAMTILAPPFPVREGTLVNYWFYVRLSGVENADFTPFVRFVNAQGQSLGQIAVNGPNFRGTTFGNGWMRRQVDLPVPQGATHLVPLFQWYPLDGETLGGKFWISSLGSPGFVREMTDPQLPEIYFGPLE